tara:strand:+ start:157 stop:591 length:435 start_codon:yes stop_codon:yes gene_type:complete
MSNPLFHNNTVNINDVWFESHRGLLQQLCVELGHPNKIEEMSAKFLGTKLKMKAYKDPNKPKRAKSAYFYFCDDVRPPIITKYQKQNKAGKMKGESLMGAVAKECAAKWGKLTDSQKTKYNKLAAGDKERYSKAMAAFNESNGN